MAEFDNEENKSRHGVKGEPKSSEKKPVDLIANRLRDFYDQVTEEGTPDHLLDLLGKLDRAEKKARSKSDK